MNSQSDPHVYLNVYDLVEHNDWTYWCGVGVFHSGVEVYGVEYAFGGHEYDAPGVFATTPRQAPGTLTWRQAIDLGPTSLSPAQVYEVVQRMGSTYRGNAYHLLQMNCNTFSDDLTPSAAGLGVEGEEEALIQGSGDSGDLYGRSPEGGMQPRVRLLPAPGRSLRASEVPPAAFIQRPSALPTHGRLEEPQPRLIL
ncbi:hypothetical protein H632_c60p1 [Helicosporidium sp. ATCC 50920]|nr:hypothetical protein H632_c60p1 [Helicosporidium sp. ATCC 50920]|eukprot:KDD76939.1 hypothetical protein H632_c60p1 [Helicosporidium sp. ATCC 50920]